MIHDLIPLEFPDHHVPLGKRLHKYIVRNTAEFANALIVPSNLVRASLQQPASLPRLANMPTHVELLPVSSAFLTPAEPDPDLVGADYFIAVGAIEAHKNHVLLLEVWKRLIAMRGALAPKLVIAGFRSVTSKPVIDFMEANPALQGKVTISSGLATPSLRRLMMSAKALLMPSIAEGFGLPIIEALALGTPVLASDIPAMREAGEGGDVTYLPAADASRWLAEIQAFEAAHPVRRPKLPAYRPKSWDEYFEGIEAFLLRLVSQRS
jgi:glycosyltransferase involved in cell wall biosynthesis